MLYNHRSGPNLDAIPCLMKMICSQSCNEETADKRAECDLWRRNNVAEACELDPGQVTQQSAAPVTRR